MIEFSHVTFTYPESRGPALRDVTLALPEATFALVVGPSGAGKSTLLRCVNGLVPHFSGGAIEGDVCVDGLDPVRVAPQVMSRHVGFVFQDPEAQFVMDQVEDEIAFALENAAIPRGEMRVRVEESLRLMELQPLRDRHLDTLSGGERQRVAIAAALALRPRILVLDEPTSQLDPQSAEDVLSALVRLNSTLGLTVLLSEHRLERVLPFADTLVYLPYVGSRVVSGPPRDVLREMACTPPLVTLGKALGWDPLPLTIEEGRQFTESPQSGRPTHVDNMTVPRTPEKTSPDEPYLQIRSLKVAYGDHTVLRGVNLDVWPGEIALLMGRNGAGKTTLLRSILGLVQPRHGNIRVAGQDIAGRSVAEVCRKVGYLPQDPNALLFADTVFDELMTTLRNHGLEGEADRPMPPADLLERLGLAHYSGAYPRDLSAGERQRVALGAITVTGPRGLLLDEPTRGLDYAAKQDLLELLRGWRDEGVAILLVTHDVELAAEAADRVLLMSQGQIIASGDPSRVLRASPLFTPQTARLYPGTHWLTPADVLTAGQ